jgi:hypothetical protein
MAWSTRIIQRWSCILISRPIRLDHSIWRVYKDTREIRFLVEEDGEEEIREKE